MLVYACAFVMLGFVTAWFLQQRRISRLSEQLMWIERRDYLDTGDITDSGEVRRLRRRLAGLLASPRMYLRARRVLGPLNLPTDELLMELELIELCQIESIKT